MKLLSLFLAVLTVAYLLPFSVFAEKTVEDAVIRGEIEVSGNTEASYPSETNGRLLATVTYDNKMKFGEGRLRLWKTCAINKKLPETSC